MSELKYRPDIDGLRAFAVLSVLGFHAFPRWFSGGFVGVDVFFVISGFLITTIILTGLQQKSFSLKTFYKKRIKRIFPALLLILVSFFFVGWLIFLDTEFAEFGKHTLGGAGFASNLVLREETGYFDSSATLKPLLHLWSLSIEEQFYIFWPLLISVLWKTKLPLAICLTLLIGGSFALNILTLPSQPAASFYLLQNRAWELGMGGLLAVLLLFHRQPLRSVLAALSKATTLKTESIRSITAFTGLLLLCATVFVFNAQHPYPGWRALLPTIGTVLIIAAGKETWVNNKLLSHRSMVGVGLISFPLYLWHWPLLSFLHILNRDYPSSAARTLALALSFLLAWLTYHFIEKPIRFGKQAIFKIPLLCTGMIGIGFLGLLAFKNYFQPRSHTSVSEDFEQAIKHWEFPEPGLSSPAYIQTLSPLPFQGSTFFIQSSQFNPNQVLYIGDSQMQVYASRITHLISTEPKLYTSAVFATQVNCSPILNVKKTDQTDAACEALPRNALQYAKKADVTTVVIGGHWGVYLNSDYYYVGGNGQKRTDEEGLYRELENMLFTLKQQKKRLFLILEPPMGQELEPAKLISRNFNSRAFRFDLIVNKSSKISRTKLAKDEELRFNRLKEIARRTGAKVINPADSLCEGDVCPALTKAQEPMYKDEGHPRPSYIREHGLFLDATLKAN